MALPKLFAKREVANQGELIKDDAFDNRFAKAERKSRFEEFVRLRLNIYIVTIFTAINVLILFPIGLETWLMNLFGQSSKALFNYVGWWLFIPLWLFPYVTWHYSTITIPLRKGHAIKLDWAKTTKGRMMSAIINIGTFHVMSWAACSKYITEYFLNYLSSVQVGAQFRGILLVDDLDSFILILYVSPVIFSLIITFVQSRDYLVNKDLLEPHFNDWEAPFIRRFAHELQMDSCDIIVGYELDTKKPIVIKENERFLHEAVIGATGSGKTSTTILLRIAQDLIKIATGRRKMGLVLLEPKGDAVDDVLTLCKKLGIPDEKIKVIDPLKSWSIKYNPFSGNRESAAASFQGTLDALTGDQDAFFKGQQNETAQTFTLLAKIRYGNLTNVTHVQRMFTDPRYLADVVEDVRKSLDRRKEEEDLTPEIQNELESIDQIVSYFENEVLDYKTMRKQEEFIPLLYPHDHPVHANKQMVENKKDKFVTGAKKYLNDIALNSLLKSLFICNDGEEAFDADKFLAEGGVLLVNTCLAELEELSLMFGQFFIRQFQSAIFRRPKEGRIPIYFYIDEFPLYVNASFERILTLGRSYKVGVLIAMQSIAQLDTVGSEFKEAILGNASHKTVFGRGPNADNEYFSETFGEELIIEESLNESASPMTSENQTWGYRLNSQKKLMPRFSTTDIRSLPFKQMIVQIVDETNSIATPKRAIGKFVHEAKFIKRYMDLVKDDIKSTEEKEFHVSNYIERDKLQQIGSSASTTNPPAMLGELATSEFEHSDVPSDVLESAELIVNASQDFLKQQEYEHNQNEMNEWFMEDTSTEPQSYQQLVQEEHTQPYVEEQPLYQELAQEEHQPYTEEQPLYQELAQEEQQPYVEEQHEEEPKEQMAIDFPETLQHEQSVKNEQAPKVPKQSKKSAPKEQPSYEQVSLPIDVPTPENILGATVDVEEAIEPMPDVLDTPVMSNEVLTDNVELPPEEPLEEPIKPPVVTATNEKSKETVPASDVPTILMDDC